MLVLKRKKSESLVVDGGIRITVLRVHGNAISLGIEAPDDVRVWREELTTARRRTEGDRTAHLSARGQA